MKKFTLTVNGKTYSVMGESIDTIKGWQPFELETPEGRKTVGGMPQIWKDNLTSIVEEDLTAELEKGEMISDKRGKVDKLLADEKILDYLENLFMGVIADSDTPEDGGE